MSERLPGAGGTPPGGHPPGAQPSGAGAEVDVAQLTERVYRLMLDDVRLEQTRRGTQGVPRRGG